MNATDYDFVITHPEGYELDPKFVGNAHVDVYKRQVGVRIFLPMIGMMGIDWAYGFDKIMGSSQYGGSPVSYTHLPKYLRRSSAADFSLATISSSFLPLCVSEREAI